jgi:Skp family chaperone for outer membrane proteins
MKLLRSLAFGVLCLGRALASAHAAEPQKPTIIAIVDVQRILQESGAAKSVQTQIEAHRSRFQSQISAEEKELREAEQKLTAMRQSGNSEAFSEQEQKLRQRFMTVERHVQARRKVLDQAFTEAMGTVRQNIINIVQRVSQERGVNLAVVKQQVIWNDGTIDITDEVLKRLNAKLPRIDVQVQPEERFEAEPPVFNELPSKKKANQALERKR